MTLNMQQSSDCFSMLSVICFELQMEGSMSLPIVLCALAELAHGRRCQVQLALLQQKVEPPFVLLDFSLRRIRGIAVTFAIQSLRQSWAMSICTCPWPVSKTILSSETLNLDWEGQT